MEDKQITPSSAIEGSQSTSVSNATTVASTPRTARVSRLASRGFVRLVVIIVLSLLVIAGSLYIYLTRNQRQITTASSVQPASSYDVQNIPLGSLSDGSAFGLNTSQSLSINGQLRANNTIVLSPTLQPGTGVAGQVYYDSELGRLAYFDGSQFTALAGVDQVDSLQASLQSLQGQLGQLQIPQLPTDLALLGELNNFSALNTFSGGLAASSLNVSGAVSLGPTTVSSLILSNPLSVSSGGTGQVSLPVNGVLIGQGGSPVGSVSTATSGFCLMSTAGAPSFQPCPGGAGGVNSFNGLTGAVTLANSSAGGSTVTINDASTAAKGIAQFNASNFSVSGGTVNTIQDISVSATPTFGGLSTAGTITAGSFSGNGSALTNVNADQLSGQSAAFYLNAANLNTGTLSDARLSVNVAKYNDATANFTGNLQENGNDVCTTAGNCSSTGVGGSGTAGVIAVWNGTGFTIGDSLLTQDTGAGTVTVAGSVIATGFTGNGSGLTNVNAATFNGQAASYYLNASNISSGTLADARLSGNVAKYSDSVAAFLGSGSFVGTVSGADAVNTDDFVTLSQLNGAIGGVGGGVSSLNSLATDLIIQGTVGQISVSDNGTDTITLALDSAVTLQGNAFNGANQLVQLNASGFLPALNGSLLTNVNAATLQGQAGAYYLDLGNATGTLNVARIADASLTNAKLANSSLTVTAGNGLVNGGSVALGGTTTLNVGAGDGISVTADAIAVDNTVCRTSGNCLGSGGAVSGSGTAGTIAVWDGAGFSLTDSIITQTGITDITVGGNLTATNLSGNGSGLTSLNASNVSTGTLSDARLSTNVTLQGNTFNGNSQLVQLNASGQLPALNGSLLTNLNASSISSGTLGDARLSANVALLNTAANFTSTLQQGGNDVCTTAGNCVGSGGSGAVGGSGTAGTIAVWTGSGFTIGDSLLSQNSGTVLLSGAGTGTISTAGTNQTLTLQGNGTGGVTVLVPTFENANGATYTFDAADTGAVNATICTTAGNCLGSGGAVSGSGTAGTIALWTGSGFSLTDSIATQSGGVVTIAGDLVATNLQGNGSSVTNVNAAQLGGQAGSYYTNASNLGTGTLADARLTANVTLQGNTFNGANQLVQLNAGAQLPVLDGSLLTSVDAETLDGQDSTFFTNATNITSGTLADGRLSTNVALFDSITANFTGNLQENGNDVCTTAGNCLGSGGGVSGSGTAGTIAVWNGTGFTLGDSLLSESAGVVTVAGDLAATNLQGNGSGITDLNASNINTGTLADVRLSANVTLAGNTFNGANQLVQLNASGQLPALNGSLLTSLNASNIASGTLSDARLSANVALYGAATANFTGVLQQGGNNVCTTAGNCAGGATTVGALDGGTANANGATISGNTIYLQSASATNPGLVNTTTQTFAGNKTFTGTLSVQDVTLAANTSITVTGGATGTRPASPVEGMVYYDTTTKQLLVYANGKWQADRSTSTKIVAASNSTQAAKDAADYVVSGNAEDEINAALTAAAGGKVYLMEGTYVAGATILVPNNTTLAGSGRGTLIELADLDASENLIENSDQASGTGIVIQDLRLDGRKDLNTAGTQRGISLVSMGGGSGATARQGGKIQSVIVNNMRSEGLYLSSSHGNKLTNNTVLASGGNGIQLSGADYNTVTDNLVQGGSSDGFLIGGGSDNNTVSNNTVQGNATAGITLSTSGTNTFSGNMINGGSYGFFASTGSSNNSFTGNTLSGGSVTGVHVSSSSNNNTVTGNTITSYTSYGINLNATGATVSGNTISSVARGIVLTGDQMSVTGNTIATASLYGINLNSLNNSIITNNRISDSGDATTNNGIYLSSSDSNTIFSNHITDSSATTNNYAINISNSASDTNVLGDNTLGTGSISDTGTNTRYQSQVNAAGNLLLQPAGTIELMKDTNVTGALAVTGNATVSGGTLTVGTTTQQGSLVVHDGSSNIATIQVGNLAGNYVYTIPVTTANDTFCLLTLANCSGGAVSGIGALDGNTPSANGASIVGSTLYLQSASGTNPGLVNTTTQTFAGDKTFVGNLTVQDVSVAAGKSITITGGITGTRPASPVEGMVYFDTTTKQLLVYANGKWQADRSNSTVIVAANNSKNKDAADFVVSSADETAGNADVAIQAAIAALPANGGSVYLMEGTYTIDTGLSLPNNTTLAGSGRSTTILKLKSAINASIDMINMSDSAYKNNITIRDIQFDGTKAGQSAGTQNAISIRRVGMSSGSVVNIAGLTVDNIIIKDMYSNGMYIYQAANSKITNSYFFTNGGAGIYDNSGGNNNVITGNTIQSNTGVGLRIASADTVVSNNIIQSNTSHGLQNNSDNRATITGNKIQSNGAKGIESSGTNAYIFENTITGNTGVGIDLSRDSIVESNTISNNGGQGVYVSTVGGGKLAISNNVVSSNTSHGIYIYRSGDNSSITGNIVDTNGVAGIHIEGYLYQVIGGLSVTGNSLNSNVSYGIYLHSVAHSTVSDNSISNTGGATANNAIHLNNTYVGGVNISDNAISDTSCTTTCYAITVNGRNNYLSNNAIGNALMNDVGTPVIYGNGTIQDNGTDTIYSNQRDVNGNLINRGGAGFGINTTAVNASLSLQGGLINSQLPAPAQPTIVRQGTGGSTTYGYRVTALDGTGETLPSTERTITNANAVLDGTNYNIVVWNQVPGAIQYKIYRTTAGGTPSSTGLIATVNGASTVTFNDTGIAATTAVPAANTTGGLSIASNVQGSNATFTGGSLTVGNSTTQGSLVVNDGSSNTATIQVGNLAGNYIYTIPVTAANDTFCMLTLANCNDGGVTTVGALDGGTANANGATITASTIYLQSASGTNPGLVNTVAQTFAGDKTFNGALSTTGNVAIGTASASTTLHVRTNNATVSQPQILVEQAGTGDSSIEFKDASGKSFYVGMDASGGSAFKISSSTAAQSTFTVGKTAVGGIPDTNLTDSIKAKKVTTGAQGGTLSSITVHVGSVDTGAPGVKVALYDHDAGNNRPGNIIASTTTSQTLTPGWNAIPISGSVSASTTYWITIKSEGASGFSYDFCGGCGGDSAYYSPRPFGDAWPSPAGVVTAPSTDEDYSFYMTIAYGAIADTYDGTDLLTMSDTGALSLQGSSDSASALSIKNAAGTNIVRIDTTGSGSINLGQTGSATNVTGTLEVTGTDTSAFVVQNGSSDVLFKADTSTQTITVGTTTNTTGARLHIEGQTNTLGTAWISRNTPTTSDGGQSIAYGNGTFVAVMSSGTNRVMTSPDGVTWTPRVAAEANAWQSVTYGNGTFVAVASTGTNRVMTSSDGITWTAQAAAQANIWQSVTYGNNLFVAVSDDGTNQVMTSPDGVTWTAQTQASTRSWESVTYGNSLFVAVSDNSTGATRVMTSPDGVTWTTQTSIASPWQGVTYANGLFVAVAELAGDRVMTSPDGVTWTAQTAAESNNWQSVTYGNGTFVAVATSGTNRVMTSPDGVTWTAQAASAANNWRSVTYGNGLFAAVSSSGTSTVMTSGDIALSTRGDIQVAGEIYSNTSVRTGGTVQAAGLQVINDSPQGYIATISNTSTSTDADGLLIKLGVANSSRTTSNYFVGFATANGTVAGKIQGGSSAVAYTTTGADYAEWFKADPAKLPQPGELVALDTATPGGVRLASESDSFVGIVSTNPGFVGNGPLCSVNDENCDAEYAKTNVLVALVGQVPLKTNNEGGDIQVGDAVGASTTPGVATKVTTGSVIGYALSAPDADGMIRLLIRPKAEASNQDLQGGNLTISGSTVLSGGVSIGGDLNVTGAVKLSTLEVTNSVTIGGNLKVAGTLEVPNIIVLDHMQSQSKAPQIVVGSSAGSGGIAVIDGTDVAGTIMMTVTAAQNEALNAGELAEIVFNKRYDTTPRIVISPLNQASVDAPVYLIKTSTGYKLMLSRPAQNGVQYQFDYIIIGSKTLSQ